VKGIFSKELSQSFDDLRNAAVKLQQKKSKVERAVFKIQKEYLELPVEDMIYAFDIFTDIRKAEMLLVMHKGEARNAWVKKAIERRRQQEEGAIFSSIVTIPHLPCDSFPQPCYI